jgi:hypothetical protein
MHHHQGKAEYNEQLYNETIEAWKSGSVDPRDVDPKVIAGRQAFHRDQATMYASILTAEIGYLRYTAEHVSFGPGAPQLPLPDRTVRSAA